MNVKPDNGVIINFSFLLWAIRLAIVLSPRKMVIIHTKIFVDKKLNPLITLVCWRKTKPINIAIRALTPLTTRKIFGKTLW